MAERQITTRRRKRWCYECETYTLTHAYATDLLEERIDLCDRCAKDAPCPSCGTTDEHDQDGGHGMLGCPVPVSSAWCACHPKGRTKQAGASAPFKLGDAS